MVFRKKGLLAVAVGSILGVASHNVAATTFCIEAVGDDHCNNTKSDSIKFAREIKADDTTKAKIPTGGDGQAVGFQKIVVKQGWGFPIGSENIFIRLDLLSGGAQGKANFFADAEIEVTVSGVADAKGVIGTANSGHGDPFVVYKLPTSAAATTPDETVVFSLNFGTGIEVSGKGNIDVVYSIGSSEDVSPTNALYTKRATLIEFVDSYTFAAIDTPRATSDVEANFLKFSNDRTAAPVASFEFSEKTVWRNKGANLGSFAVTSIGIIFDFAENKTSIDVLGDFTMVEDSPAGSGKFDNAKSRVTLAAKGNDCSGGINASAVTASKATFYSSIASGEHEICISANGVSQIPAGSYSVVLNAAGKEGYDVSGETTLSDIGSIVRNGTQLITPYMTTIAGYLSRVMLSNYGSRDISYTVRLVTDDGGNATPGTAASGTIKAGTLKQINAADLVAFSGKPRGAAIFTFVGANSDIQGIYQTVNLNTFDAQSVVMRRPGSGRGIQ